MIEKDYFMKKNILLILLILSISSILYSQDLGIYFGDLINDEDWNSIKALLDSGLHPSTTDARGETIMQAAISRNSYEAVYLLLTYGYSVRGTVLLDACYNDELNPAMIELIIANGGDVNYYDDATPLYAVAISKDVMSGYVAKLLLKAGADPNRKVAGRTPYTWALRLKNRSVADAIKEYGGHR